MTKGIKVGSEPLLMSAANQPQCRGSVEIAVVGLITVLMFSALMTEMTVIVKATQRGFQLFDNERNSPLYCFGLLGHVSKANSLDTVTAYPGDQQTPCLLRRMDYAAPGSSPESAPEALCAVMLGLNHQGLDHRSLEQHHLGLHAPDPEFKLPAGVRPCS